MRLYSFRIQNFKSIVDTGVIKVSEDDNITILAGQNESGKSSILEALDFFENGVSDDFEELYRRLRTHPRVECTYLLDGDELATIELKGSKELAEHIKANMFTFVRGDTEKDDYDSLKYLISSAPKEMRDKIEKAQENFEPDEKFKIDVIYDMRPEFIFYSSFDENILPGKISKPELTSNQAVEDFETVFGVDFKKLLEEANDAARDQELDEVNARASDSLNRYWSQKVDELDSQYTYSIKAYPQIAAPEQSYVQFFIKQGDNFPLHFNQKSKGFQWFSSFNLRLRAHSADQDSLSNFILLIDEPGQGLHEEAQKDVKTVLNELADNGVQMLFSTHLAQLLKTNNNTDLHRLKLVGRSTKNGTKLQNIAQATSQSGFKDALSPVRTALGLITLDVNSFLDGKKNVITEGITDHYYLQAFAKLVGNVEVNTIPCVGVSQAPNVYSILYGWGISSKVIVDDDSAGTKAYNAIRDKILVDVDDKSIEKLLKKNTGCKGIEDTFDQDDFIKFADRYLADKSKQKPNSEVAKGNKDIIARVFLDGVNDGKIKLSDFSKQTKEKIKDLVEFMKK